MMQSLVCTYSQAIEYHQSIDSDLYMDLNLRMQNLLTRPDTLEMLDQQAANNRKNTNKIEEWIQRENIPRAPNSKLISPDKLDEELIFKPEEIRNGTSPETRDSSLNFDYLNDPTNDPSSDNDDQSFSRSTFCVKNVSSLLQEDSTTTPLKNIAKVEETGGVTNEFVFHRDDKRNRHGVSFKVCKDKKDGALLRPKKLRNTDDKKELHKELLNENKDDVAPRIFASKKVVEEYNDEAKEKQAMRAVEKDMYDQESSLKIRLLKRENQLNKRRQLNNSQYSDSLFSSSKTKSVSDKDPSF